MGFKGRGVSLQKSRLVRRRKFVDALGESCYVCYVILNVSDQFSFQIVNVDGESAGAQEVLFDMLDLTGAGLHAGLMVSQSHF